MMAHELRNPLAAIRNAVQILLRGGQRARTVRSASEIVDRQVGHMVRQVDDLLDVSRISQGKIELRNERAELGLDREPCRRSHPPALRELWVMS